jgi:hypothetical protein
MSSRGDLLNHFAIGVSITASMREQLISIQDRYIAVVKENETLKERCTALEQQCAEFLRQTASETESEFVDYRGAKFRRLPDGTLDHQVYCPKCRNPMPTPAEVFLPYRCAPCHYLSHLKGFDFPAVLEQVPESALHGA